MQKVYRSVRIQFWYKTDEDWVISNPATNIYSLVPSVPLVSLERLPGAAAGLPTVEVSSIYPLFGKSFLVIGINQREYFLASFNLISWSSFVLSDTISLMIFSVMSVTNSWAIHWNSWKTALYNQINQYARIVKFIATDLKWESVSRKLCGSPDQEWCIGILSWLSSICIERFKTSINPVDWDMCLG